MNGYDEVPPRQYRRYLKIIAYIIVELIACSLLIAFAVMMTGGES